MGAPESFTPAEWVEIVETVALSNSVLGNRLGSALDDTRHLIEFRNDGWTILHPLAERIDVTDLFDCPFRWDMGDVGYRGRYWCHLDEDGDVCIGERFADPEADQ